MVRAVGRILPETYVRLLTKPIRCLVQNHQTNGQRGRRYLVVYRLSAPLAFAGVRASGVGGQCVGDTTKFAYAWAVVVHRKFCVELMGMLHRFNAA
jgi:hypothetical protein